ncbi:MAG TPA: carboxypeptidase-like regulatory domain-containing protein, partial [Terriglobia bacterium]|nr:carboxypeptidase-like regulatory domain-containing protein [Terriglobia bacterium]
MKTSPRDRAWTKVALIGLVLLAGAAIYPLAALQNSATTLGYIQGTVRSSAGPEAGVWVIAETRDLPTGMIKSVVTDDQGRYVLPDMPMVNYSVWVRGYGLADSKPVTARPTVNTNNNAPALALTAVIAKDPVEAAKVYPGDYWMSMLVPPAASAFPIGQGTSQTSLDGWMHAF